MSKGILKTLEEMDAAQEMRLAALIAQEAALQSERSRDIGVTAFLQRPVQRARPNERFLRNTLSNLESGG